MIDWQEVNIHGKNIQGLTSQKLFNNNPLTFPYQKKKKEYVYI